MTLTFFHPLKEFHSNGDKRKAIIFWLSLLFLLTIKISCGGADFFENSLRCFFADGHYSAWYRWIYHHLASLLLLCLLPIGIVRFLLNENVFAYGIGPGDWKFGIKATFIAFSVLLFPLYVASHNPEHLKLYPLVKLNVESPAEIGLWGLVYLPHYIGWEFFFRGFIGIGIRKQYGAFPAIMLQILLTTLMHMGKPAGEFLGAIPAGIYLGLLTYRTNSVWWAVLFHWYVGMANSYFCSVVQLY